jgi:rhodanese-related sulfurtransferase
LPARELEGSARFSSEEMAMKPTPPGRWIPGTGSGRDHKRLPVPTNPIIVAGRRVVWGHSFQLSRKKSLLTTEAIRPDGVVIKEISPTELKERLDGGAVPVLIDVREPFETLLADLPDHGQMNIPVKDIPSRARELHPDQETVLYCRSGPRSAWATERLQEMGFRNVLNLKGGIMAWRADVDPSVKVY